MDHNNANKTAEVNAAFREQLLLKQVSELQSTIDRYEQALRDIAERTISEIMREIASNALKNN